MSESVQHIIDSLFWDRRYVRIPDDIESPSSSIVIIKDPTAQDRNIYNYDLEYLKKRAIAEGVPSEDEMIELAIEGGTWSTENNDKCKKIEDHIGFLTAEIATQKLVTRKKKMSAEVETLRKELVSISSFRNQLLANTAEHHANEAAILNSVYRLTLNDKGESFWLNEQQFLEDRDFYKDFIYHIASEIVNQGVLPTEKYRQIARSMEWRILWISQREDLNGLFGRPACDLTMRQVMLLYWSRVYDQVFEDPDKPDQDIIEDDEKLDKWLSNKNAERQGARKKSAFESKHKTSSDHHEQAQTLEGHYCEECNCGALDHKRGLGEALIHSVDCDYGVWLQYSDEERLEVADSLYGRNTKAVRNLINREMEVVADKEEISEQKLRGKKSRMLLGSESKIIPIKKR